MRMRFFILLLTLMLMLLLPCGCTDQKAGKASDEELGALAAVAGVPATDFLDVTGEALTKERAEKFPAVSFVLRTESGLYGFISKPIAYNGPVELALVIDGASGECLGVRILKHSETDHYVRDMESSWFTDRFAGKSAAGYLQLVRLEAKSESDIVCITGATVTTEGVINGVNAAFGLFQEYVRQEEAPAVPYMVRFEPAAAGEPVETGSLAIRAYGVVLHEITLEEIKELPSVRRRMSIRSSSGTTSHSFRGTLLANVLELADPSIAEGYKWLRTVGVDDYMSDISMEEVQMENNVFLMHEDNGEPLLRKNGEPGAMRIVVIDDMFGQRFTNYVLEVVLEGGAE
ncbi:MAG: FMN-binding protein [Clostridiales bacterium]|nr:FMN-binding protein [Clostridiales bacterium]